jgi:hypothetical protein
MAENAIEPATNADRERVHTVDGVTRHLVYSLALVPIVPAASIACTTAVATVFQAADVRLLQSSFSVLVIAGTILIWRRTVLWTTGRKGLTAIVSLIPFVQVAVNLPLWTTAGCLGGITDDFLRMGQHQIGVSIWAWMMIWIWWGWEKLGMMKTTEPLVVRIGVTSVTKRVAASIGMIPLLIGVLIIAGEAARRFLPNLPSGANNELSEPVSFAIVLALAVTVWVLNWRGAVAWSAVAWRRTRNAAIVLLALPSGLMFTFAAVATWAPATILGCLAFVGLGVWMGWTMHIWPMKPEAVAVDPMGPRCLSCGYSLRGLRATRCPECGEEPTLDELWAAGRG